jgi:hypothetical protein
MRQSVSFAGNHGGKSPPAHHSLAVQSKLVEELDSSAEVWAATFSGRFKRRRYGRFLQLIRNPKD